MNLKEFLDDCKENNIITDSLYKNIFDHYLFRQNELLNARKSKEKEQNSKSGNTLMITVAIIGVILVGFGIIYLFAHNWDQLSRFTKTFLSMVPVIISIGANFFTILKRKDNVIWQETVAVYTFFAVGSMLALILQIYQLPGIENYFFIYWCALCLPLVYILNSHGAVFCSIILILLNLISTPFDQSTFIREPWFGSIILFSLLIPYFKKLFTTRQPNDVYFLHEVILPIAISINILVAANQSQTAFWLVSFLLMANLNLFGTSIFMRKTDRNPNLISILSYIGLSLCLSFLLFVSDWNFDKIFTNYGAHLIFIPLLFILGIIQLVIYFKKEKLESQNAYKLLIFFPLPFVIMNFFGFDVLSIYQISCIVVSLLFAHFSLKNNDYLQLYPSLSVIAILLFSFVFSSNENFALFFFSLIPSLYYFAPAYFINEKTKSSINAEQTLVVSFQLLILIIASFEGFWMTFKEKSQEFSYTQIVILIFIILGILAFAFKSNKQIRQHFSGIFGLISLLVPILIFIACISPIGIQHLFTILLLLLGLITLIYGAKKSNLTLANLALGLIGLVMICRFFDLKMSLTVKGIIFIAIGTSFFLSNYLILKNKRHENIS
jgi:uncharacterized membrane protein